MISTFMFCQSYDAQARPTSHSDYRSANKSGGRTASDDPAQIQRSAAATEIPCRMG
jgi:hypothetical protein